LTILASVLIFGSVIQMVLKKFPGVRDMVNLVDSQRIFAKFNINTASVEELVQVPYIGKYTAKNIVEYRQKHGPFTKLEHIKRVKGIRDKNFEIFSKYLIH